jgi:hypothetical protein
VRADNRQPTAVRWAWTSFVKHVIHDDHRAP